MRLVEAWKCGATHFQHEGDPVSELPKYMFWERTSGNSFVINALPGSTADTCAASVYGGF